MDFRPSNDMMWLGMAGTGGISGHLYFVLQALESFEKESKPTSVTKLLQISSFLRSMSYILLFISLLESKTM